MLSALAAERDFQRFCRGTVYCLALAIQNNSIPAAFVNQKRPLKRPQEGVVSLRSFVYACLLRLAKNDPGGRKGFAKELSGKLRYRLFVFFALAGGYGRAGGDTAEWVLPPAVAQPFLEAPDQHAHLHAFGPPILVGLVEHDELPALPPVAVKQCAIVGTDEQILEHGVVGQQDVGAACYASPCGKSARRAGVPPRARQHYAICPSCLLGVWPIYCPNVGSNPDPASCRSSQIFPKALALIVCKRVHRV